jgi:dihydrofolate synthase / folylpolyglutamate synthase
MSFVSAVEHLHSLGLELAPSPTAPRRKFDLDHMRILARALGDPQLQFPSILIAGTNGKGSTAATLASILAAAGLRTGLYTSPHLTRVTERIRISNPIGPSRHSGAELENLPSASSDPASPPTDNRQLTTGNSFLEIPESNFARLYFRIDDAARNLVATAQLPHHPSFFETLTALAFLYFAEQKIDIAVLEVGLGGRLDATNIVHPILSIITDIALDHQEYLGPTITDIAREKAGILRAEGTLITLPQHPEANQAIGEAAIALNVHAISATPYLPGRNFAPPTQAPQDLSHNVTPQNRVPQVRSQIDPGNTSNPTTEPGTTKPGTTKPGTTEPGTTEPGAPFMAQPHRDMSGVPTTEPHTPSFHPAENGAPTTEPPTTSAGGAPYTSVGRQPHVDSPHQPRAGGLTYPSPSLLNHYDLTLDGETLKVRSPLPGEHQRRNIALAIAAAIELRNYLGNKQSPTPPTSNQTSNNNLEPSLPSIERGIAATSWPGRLEFLPPNLLLDVAHNPAGAWTLRAAIAALPEDLPRTLIFSCLRDKDLTEMSQILFPLFDSSATPPSWLSSRSAAEGFASPTHNLILTPINSPRAASLEDLLSAARNLDIPAHPAEGPAEALALARSLTPANGLILATGSIYLIGALREQILTP